MDRDEIATNLRRRGVIRPEDEYLTRNEAAVFLKISRQTLDRWAMIGEGPKWHIVGRKALYSVPELRRYLHGGDKANQG